MHFGNVEVASVNRGNNGFGAMPKTSAGVILLAFRQGRRRRLPCQRPRHCPKTPKDRSGAAGAGLQGHRAKAGCRQPRPRTRQTWLCGCRAALFPLVYRCYPKIDAEWLGTEWDTRKSDGFFINPIDVDDGQSDLLDKPDVRMKMDNATADCLVLVLLPDPLDAVL